MRTYELMVILDPTIDERTVVPMMEKFLAPVKASDGSVEKVDVWGKRRLAYDILRRFSTKKTSTKTSFCPASPMLASYMARQ